MKTVSLAWLLIALLTLLPLALNAETGTVQSAFSITRSTSNGIQVHFTLPEWKLEQVELNGEIQQRVVMEGMPYLNIGDKETLPVFGTMVAVPYSGGASLNVLGTNPQNRKQITMDFDALLSDERDSGRYSDLLYPADNVLLSSPQVIRDFRVVTLNICPFQYDQQSKQLIVNESIDIRIDFNRSASINEIEPPTSYSSAFTSIYQGLILNYNEAIDRDVSYTSPKMLVIYGNYADTTYQTKVNEYVAWKQQKGYLVTAVSTATIGTSDTAIKSYIQTMYNNTATRPDYIVLIGDSGSGSMQIPTNGSYIDYYYTWLAGGDNLGDVVIGRISVETTEQMINYMAKLVSLEQNINLGTAAWLNRMVLVGDTAHSGISTIYTNEYIEDLGSAVNPSYTYTEEFSSSPSNANVNTAINQGVAFYNYRGYWGMSGWPSTISSLNNGYKLFHAVIITCGTGDFSSGTATTESVVRQGTSASLGGSITAIGMATTSTATPQNNCLDSGIFHSIFNLGTRDMGTAMLYGKLYLNAIYGVSAASTAYNFSTYCNLIGDPTAEVYIGIPSTLSVTAPTSIPAGSSSIQVTVKNASNEVIPGAAVTLTNASGLQVTGFTGDDGKVMLSFATTLTGSLTLTVDKNDFKPAVSTISIAAAGGLVFANQTVEDGDNNIANSGETIEFYVGLKNTTTSTLTPSVTVSTADPYITLVDYDRIEYSPITSNNTGQNDTPIVFDIAPNCPDMHTVLMNLFVETTSGNYNVAVSLTVRSGKLDMQSYTLVGSTGNIIYPGNTFPMYFSLYNSGLMNLSSVNARLRSGDMFFSVTDSIGVFGNINQGATVSNSSSTFTVYARGACIEGATVPLTLYLFNGDGFEQYIDFDLTLGQPGLNDPLGQDEYGYFIFDDGDTSYDQCPTYQWIGVAPAEGGSGTALSITDPGSGSDEGDQVGAVSIQTVSLPFTFTYYGVDYTQASISSNGFISFGSTVNSDWRNWRMPDAGGPSQMIAVFWDDLEFGTGSGVYTYYNSTQHYYVVEWYNLLSGYNASSLETFQAILYDPVFHPTHTGDGQIKLQYKEINNIDLGASEDHFPHGNFATVGIEDHTASVGLEYTFNNTYPTQAKPLANEIALFITTRPLLPDYPYIAIDDVVVLDANSNTHLEPGETSALSIVLGNRGLVGATNVAATLSSTDPYVTITNNYSYYGNIAAQMNAAPQTNYTIAVSGSCPSNHNINFTLSVTSATGNWTYNFAEQVVTPILGFSNQVISDVSGNQNGILDPGETAIVTIRVNNTGQVASTAGTATLSCGTTGITINTGSDTFSILAPGAYETLTFNISAASTMTDGTMVALNYNATAGAITGSAIEYVEVGAPIEVIIGTGTSGQSYPIDRYYNYSAHEAIYLASEIAMAGTLKSIAIQKVSGADMNGIQFVTIYMKNTPASSLATGVYSTAGYTQVYSGTYPNNAASGWMEVNLNPMFLYDGVSNLSILMIKGFEQYITNYPNWSYTSTPTNRARQNRSDTEAPTSLSATNYLPNIRLKVFPNLDLLFPPQDLAASESHQSVNLSWTPPVSGTPTGYKVYRDTALLASPTGLTYTDLAVTNGTTYSYTVSAVYTEGESDPSPPVEATPNAIAPTNLIAIEGVTLVNLSWTGATGRNELGTLGSRERSISSYRIYRNGSPLTTTTNTTYQDTGLTNGVTYSYYVTTVYINPAGESAASNTATATPGDYMYITIGSGTGTQAYPIDRYYSYSAHEAIYLATEIGMAGTLKSVSFYKASGTDVNPIGDVSIYMKTTTASIVAPGDYSTDGYTLVYSGTFPNTAEVGWMEVNLNPQFVYDGSSNLSILIVKGFEQWINNYPMWTYSTTATTRARQEHNDNVAPVTLTATNNLPNLKLKVQPVASYLPPLNLAATASHQSVLLTWSLPASGTPTGYQIYKNSALLTTVTSLTYTDTAVTNGTTYSYYLKAVYSGGESNATTTVTATPNAIAPTNLTAVAGNAIVDLSWTGATGRSEVEGLGSRDRTISSYRIYRNGTALNTTTGTTYQDTGLTNGVTYSYYVTTVYTNPAGESAASNTVNATPASLSFVVLGSGTLVTSGNQNAPTNITNRSVHSQLVYTAAELNAAGVTGPIQITGLGFNIVTAPNLALPSFVVRMKHTTATNSAAWHDATGLITTYSNASYMPTAGGYDMLTFSTPFTWNGTDNILVDTAFGLVATASQTGTLQYTTVTSGYRFAWSNSVDQTAVYTGGTLNTRRYNVRLALSPVSVGPIVEVAPTTLTYGNVAVNGSSAQQFTVRNTGDQPLTGTITTPTGYTVALVRSDNDDSPLMSVNPENERNTLDITVDVDATNTYSLTFNPTTAQAYSGNVVVSTNAGNSPTVNIAVSGTGTAAYVTVNPTTMTYGNVAVNATNAQTFSVQNTGNITLTGSITTPTGYTVALQAREVGDGMLNLSSWDGERNTLSISVTAGATNTYTLTFAPTTAQAYNGNVVVATNATNSPTVNIAVTGTGTGALITVNPTTINYGNIAVNNTSVQQFTVQNSGNITLTGSIVTPTGYTVALQSREDESGLLSVSSTDGERNTLGISVTAGQTRTYSLTFAPTAVQAYSGNVVVSTNAYNNSAVNVAVSGTGIGALATVNTTSLTYGNVPVNTTFAQQFTVQNTGNITLTGTITTPTGFAVALQGRDGEYRNTLSISVNTGETKTYSLTFAPTAVQAYSGNVVIATNAVNTPTANIAVSGTGTGSLITVNPTSVNYGNVAVNTTSAQQFTVQNTGNVTLTGTITTPTGYSVILQSREDDGGTQLLSSLDGNRNTLGISVAVGQTRTYTLTFAPTALQGYSGNVVVSTNAINTPTANIAVSGTGTGAVVTVNPTTLTYGNVAVNTTSTQQFTVQNTGNVTLTGSIVTPAGYSVALQGREGEGRNTLAISVLASETKTYVLTFAPTAIQGYSGNVVVTTNATNTPTVNIAVSGTGTGAVATVNPTTLTYGDIEVGSNSSQLFSIQNTGNIALTGSIVTPAGYTVSLSGRDAEYRNTLSISIPAGETRNYNLLFEPTAATTYNGNLVISTNSLNNPTINVSVTGTGVILDIEVPVVVVSGTESGLELSWPAVPNAVAYNIYSSTDPYGAYTLLDTTTQLTYMDIRRISMAFYHVRAVRN